MKNKLIIKTLRNVSLASLYIFVVSLIMNNGEKLFGNVDNNSIGPLVFLLLFSSSAAIVGGLVFGEAIYLFLDNKKNESVKAAIYSVAWLVSFTFIGLVLLFVLNRL